VRGWCQANVNESLETAVLYVNTATGSNSNPGTSGQPLQTIGAAVGLAEANNLNNIGTKVIVEAGTYRESITIAPPYQGSTIPLTVQAATGATVTVSGGQQFTGWQPYPPNPNIYTDAWTYEWGLCNTLSPIAPPAPNIVLHQEMAYVNGTRLNQVLSLNEVVPGTFFVDVTGQTIYVWPPSGTNMNTADVEVGVLPSLLAIEGQSNVVIRGLTFQYANSCRETAAVTVTGNNPGGASNVLFDTDSFVWNNAQGLSLGSTLSNFTVQNSIANHNGEAGFQATKVTAGLYQSDQSSYNNWRGAQGAYYWWNSAGAHFYEMHNLAISNFTSSYNLTNGMHYDTDNQNINITSMTTYGDLLASLLVEKDEGPVNITGSTFCGNGTLASYEGGTGLSVRDSENVSLTNSNLVNNNFSLYITGVPGGYPETNWQTGQNYQLVNSNLTLTNDVIEGLAGQQAVSDSLGGSDWSQFQSTLDSNLNTWWNAANSTPFAVPEPTVGTMDNFPGWQSLTGQDQGSVFQTPSGNPSAACSSAVDLSDYWLLVPYMSGSLTVSQQTSAVFNATMVPLNFTGTAQLSYDGVQNIPGGTTASWSPTSIGPNQSANFTVTPGANTPSGTYPVTLIATSGSVTRTVTVFVVVDATVELSETSLNFGNQLINTASAAQPVTLTNSGSMPLSISSISFSGAQQGAFSETDNCVPSLPGNSSCTISISFTPGNTGGQVATMNINDSDATSPQQVALSGTGTQPAASLTPSSLTFANQVVGTTSGAQQLTLTNTGTATLTITSVIVGGANSGDFGQTNTCGSSLAAGANCTISVTFTPAAANSRSGKITVTDSAGNPTQISTLSGTGIQSATTLSPTFLSFGPQVWGTTAASQAVTLTNSGTAPLSITSLAITGANTGDFAQTNNCGSSVAVNASCSINVTFTPQALGSRSASITITDNAPNSPQSVTLMGTGLTSLSYTPQSITFASRVVGSTSAPWVVTLTNLGKALQIQGITIKGSNPGDFAQTNTCGSLLAVNGTCVVNVTFTPLAGGTRTANLSINDPDPTSPQVIGLTGTGTTAPAVSLAPGSLTFSNQVVGVNSPSQPITLANTGSASLSVTSIAVTGANSGDFSQTNNCGSTVAVNASCVISVTFNPIRTGSRSANITVTDNASPATQTVSLAGAGIQAAASFSPTSLSFGTQVWNTSATAQVVTLTNTGTATMTISSIAIGGSDPGDYAQTNTCGTSLAAGANCSISVIFTPQALGSRPANVSVTDNAPNSPQTVNLNGTGLTSVSFTPASIGFGTRKAGTTSPIKTVTVTNLGNALPIQSIVIGGANPGDFAQTNNCGSGLAAGASCTISVTFTPTVVGSRSATININDSDPTSPQQVTLSGTGD
jgi:hypothetical protein